MFSSKSRLAYWTAILVLVCFASVGHATNVTFELIGFSPTALHQHAQNRAYDINNAGQMVGAGAFLYFEDIDSPGVLRDHAFIWEYRDNGDGTHTKVSTHLGGHIGFNKTSAGIAINEQGHVAGTIDWGYEDRGFVYDGEDTYFLYYEGHHSSNPYGGVTGINDQGQVVGYEGFYEHQPMIWQYQNTGGDEEFGDRLDGSLIFPDKVDKVDLPYNTYPEDRATRPMDINNNGDIVGYHEWHDPDWGSHPDRAAIGDENGMRWMDEVPDAETAAKINDKGLITGTTNHFILLPDDVFDPPDDGGGFPIFGFNEPVNEPASESLSAEPYDFVIPGDLPKGFTVDRAYVYDTNTGELKTNLFDEGDDNEMIESMSRDINRFGDIVGRRDNFELNADEGIQEMANIAGKALEIENMLDEASSAGWQIGQINAINDKMQMAGWGWDPDGKISAFMLQPKFEAPTHFMQNDDAWGDELLYDWSSDSTLAKYGCVMTSLTMILNTYGHAITPADFNVYLPDEDDPLNPDDDSAVYQDLTLTRNINGSFSYGQQINDESDKGIPVHFDDYYFKGQTEEEIRDEIRRLIVAHGPIMLRVPQIGSATGDFPNAIHAIVAWKVEDGQIYVRDPLTDQEKLDALAANGTLTADAQGTAIAVDDFTLDHYLDRVGWTTYDGQYQNWLPRATYARELTPDDAGKLQGAVRSPVDVVVIDPLGRRFGYDPNTGTFYDEIPDSYYTRLEAIAAINGDSNGLDFMPIDFTIGDVVDGDYTVLVFGLTDASGEWDVNLDFVKYLETLWSEHYSGTLTFGFPDADDDRGSYVPGVNYLGGSGGSVPGYVHNFTADTDPETSPIPAPLAIWAALGMFGLIRRRALR